MYVIKARQLLTMPADEGALSEPVQEADLASRDDAIVGLIEEGAVVIDDEKEEISWVGEIADLPDWASGYPTMEAQVVMPGWIDCHTHAVFAGERSQEFMLRNAGTPYVEILEAGGGILNSVDALRQASTDELTQSLLRRVYQSVRLGVTTMEVKSGYGLTTSDELKSLKAVARAQDEAPLELVPCFLGAHAIPRNYRDRRQDYVDKVCQEMIPAVVDQGLADYCDVFCDRGAFDVEEARRILEVGKDHGLTPRIHVDEIEDLGGAVMAADVGCASADHLEHTPDEGIEAMVEAGVTAVLMPAVNLYLGTLDELAPARQILEAGGEVALASDFNPGSAMTQDLGWILNLGCTLYKMTPGEALYGVTRAAASALDRRDIGALEAGARADVACFSVPHYRYLPYHPGQSHATAVIHRGTAVYWTEESLFDG